MAEKIGDTLQAELKLVAAKLEETIADLPQGLAHFVRSEMGEDRVLAGVVLASAAPARESAEDESRRVALAAALELLQIATEYPPAASETWPDRLDRQFSAWRYDSGR